MASVYSKFYSRVAHKGSASERGSDQGTKGPEDEGTRGQLTKGPKDQGTKGPGDQRTRGLGYWSPNNVFLMLIHCLFMFINFSCCLFIF